MKWKAEKYLYHRPQATVVVQGQPSTGQRPIIRLTDDPAPSLPTCTLGATLRPQNARVGAESYPRPPFPQSLRPDAGARTRRRALPSPFPSPDPWPLAWPPTRARPEAEGFAVQQTAGGSPPPHQQP